MSKNKNNKEPNNTYVIGVAFAVIIAILGFFTFSGSNTSLDNKSADINEVSDKTIPVEKVITTESPEEIVVTSESAKDVKDAAKKATLAEKANEAAIRNQVNEAVKNSEDSDLDNAE